MNKDGSLGQRHHCQLSVGPVESDRDDLFVAAVKVWYGTFRVAVVVVRISSIHTYIVIMVVALQKIRRLSMAQEIPMFNITDSFVHEDLIQSQRRHSAVIYTTEALS